MIRSLTLALRTFTVLLLLVASVRAAKSGETLYNGIVLASPWPPRLSDSPTSVEQDPVVPPYLVSPPGVIPIDVGRQLFVDDFLIAETTLTRTFHLARYHPASPVLKPDKPWERVSPESSGASYGYIAAGGPGFSSNRDTGSSGELR